MYPQGHGYAHGHERGHGNRFFTVLARIDWDTLLFFYGIILAVGALGILGYLQVLAKVAYHDLESGTCLNDVHGLGTCVTALSSYGDQVFACGRGHDDHAFATMLSTRSSELSSSQSKRHSARRIA